MDEAVHEIETHIDRTRDRLGVNLKELEEKVEAVTDWREQFRARPYVCVAAACVAGAVLGAVTRPRRSLPSGETSGRAAYSAGPRNGVDVRGQAVNLWDTIKAGLVGLGTARVKEYVGQLVPGLDEHLRRAEQQRSGHDFASVDVKRAGG